MLKLYEDGGGGTQSTKRPVCALELSPDCCVRFRSVLREVNRAPIALMYSIIPQVVTERYEELVFVSPGELFHNRVSRACRVAGPPLSVAPYVPKQHPDKDDLHAIGAARRKAQDLLGGLNRRLEALPAP